MHSTRISREELYEKVWHQPLTQLAAEFGISDRGLGKICTRLEIPLPGRGYWRKVERGIEVEKEELPPPSETCKPFETIYNRSAENYEASITESDIVIKARKYEEQSANRIVVPENIGRYHPLVKQTLEGFGKHGPNKYGLCYPEYGKKTLDISCSEELSRRAARIFHILIHALEKRGGTVEVTEGPTRIHYLGEQIQIVMREKVNQIAHKLTKKELEEQKKWSWSSAPKYDFIPSGNLHITLEFRGWSRLKKNWQDRTNARLEDQLNSLMIGLAKIVVFLQEDRAEDERKEREREERRRYQELLRLRQIEEEKRIEHLDQLFCQWIKAKQIRAFLEQVKETSKALAYPDMSQEEWLAWAYDYVNQLDPLTESSKSIPEETCRI
jgi:hypothetical protein